MTMTTNKQTCCHLFLFCCIFCSFFLFFFLVQPGSGTPPVLAVVQVEPENVVLHVVAGAVGGGLEVENLGEAVRWIVVRLELAQHKDNDARVGRLAVDGCDDVLNRPKGQRLGGGGCTSGAGLGVNT